MKLKTVVLFFLVIAILSINIFCTQTVSNNYPVLTSYASLSDTVNYVGINSCKQCHASIYESFMHTGMGSSFDIASKKKSSATFDAHAVIYDSIKNYYYKPYWQNDSLKLMEFRLAGKDTVHKLTETVNFIIGSGQHTNSHMINTNGYLHQAPATFYTQKQKWDLPPGFENGNSSRFSRIIGLECMTCHNAYPDFVMGSENKYTAVKNGIDCERCHGPGSYHVNQKQLGILVDTAKTIDYSIVNPAKLPVDLQFDICQRCHIQGNAVLNDGKSFFDFKPGMRLSEVMNVFMPVYKGDNSSHIMASHAERLKQSKCYLGTTQKVKELNVSEVQLRPYKNALTCVTCHNPHVSVRQTSSGQFTSVCKSCHAGAGQSVCSEKTKTRQKENDNCIKCHMPFSGATDIPHVSVHDHLIQKPMDKTEIKKIKEFAGITCINNPTPPAKAIGDAYIAYFEKFGHDISVLDSAVRYFAINDKISATNFSSLVQLYFLKHDYEKVISLAVQNSDIVQRLEKKSYSNTDAWTLYRIGESYKNTGDIQKSIAYYRRASMLAPFHLDILNKYATVLSLTGDIKNAKVVYQNIIREYPNHVSALTNLGFLLLSNENNVTAAEQLYEKAHKLNPDYEPLLLNMAGLNLFLNKNTEAEEILMTILKINPANKQAKEILKNVKENRH